MGKAKAKDEQDAEDVFNWKQASRDKKGLFLYWWNLYAGGEMTPVGDYEFHPTRHWKLDWSWPGNKVAVEVDGGQWMPHGGRHARDTDRDKCNEAESLGWHVFHFSTQQLETNPVAQLERVARLLDIPLCDLRSRD